MGNCAERPNAWEPKPTSSCMRESLYFKQSASIDIYIKDEQGRVIDTEEIRLRLTRPQESKHRIINGIGWSYAIFPGQDPRQFHIKECQDSCLLAENQGKFLFGVFDGHGKSGRDVSLFCVKKSTELFRDRVDSFENDEEAQLKKLVEDVAQAAETSSMVPNILISGTTAVLVYFDGKKIFVANVGDSMAVLGYYDDNRPQRQDIMTQITYMGDRILTAKPLTEMHKPSVPEEKKRVEEYGGDIRKLKDGFGEDMGPLRVFKQGSEQPGICMTRSIGDLIATEVGVISEPTITQFDYNPDIDEMLIIGSDGLWDALEGHDAVNFVQKYRDR